jgi:serine O-acetyltransferase
MNTKETISDVPISNVVDTLCSDESYQLVSHDKPMPSLEVLSEIVESLRGVIFPGYFGPSDHKPETMRYHIGATLDKVSRLLVEQIKRGFCFTCPKEAGIYCEECEQKSQKITTAFLLSIPEIRHILSTDVMAAYEGDPAAKTTGETIFCYPSIRALTNYRIAHRLHSHGAQLIPRIFTEMAHSETGIDIHPGAQIGEHFFIDHGTGVVIGETSIIGRNVRIYQGVTLGAKSFPLDEDGKPIKDIPRHPIVEDDVVIYSGATILGRITIGRGSVIGGNVWLTHDVPPESSVIHNDL